MTAQALLPFSPARLAAKADPWTSKAAARACKPVRSEHCRIILQTLQANRRPMAAEEIVGAVAGWVGLNAVQVARRFAELVEAGLIEATAEIHTNRSGRAARRYRLKEVAP